MSSEAPPKAPRRLRLVGRPKTCRGGTSGPFQNSGVMRDWFTTTAEERGWGGMEQP